VDGGERFECVFTPPDARTGFDGRAPNDRLWRRRHVAIRRATPPPQRGRSLNTTTPVRQREGCVPSAVPRDLLLCCLLDTDKRTTAATIKAKDKQTARRQEPLENRENEQRKRYAACGRCCSHAFLTPGILTRRCTRRCIDVLPASIERPSPGTGQTGGCPEVGLRAATRRATSAGRARASRPRFHACTARMCRSSLRQFLAGSGTALRGRFRRADMAGSEPLGLEQRDRAAAHRSGRRRRRAGGRR
jgi:hypothetical protein